MDLGHLRYFREVARSSSMSAAARSLRVSQPTVSLAVKRLEAQLSTKLFQRHRGGVILTESGMELLRHVDEVTRLLDSVSERIAELSKELSGAFVIGCHEALGAYFLPGVLTSLADQAPKLKVTLYNASSSEVLDAVAEGSVHFGIVVNPRPRPELVQREVFRDAVDLFMMAEEPTELPPEEEYGHVGAVYESLEDVRRLLATQPLIYPARVAECLDVLRQLSEQGIVPERRLECGDFTLTKSLAVAGLGPALLPRRIAREGKPGLRRVHADLPIYEDSIYLVFRANLHRTRGALFLKDELIRCGKAMPSVGV